ncbi:hypothetical protein [Francisella marina]|uniref:Uncharacterized protein n=1 Tax=Francisella marina TaxID=2249302 RepID=A0ABX5ZGJ2_9GAMM|nr:hypothetical protein [Francisella marina]QEO57561.1 hypothetical protein F0R74_06735 [Francisella marina]
MIGLSKLATTLVINGRVITDYYEDTVVDMSFPNAKHNRKRTATHVIKSKNIARDEAEITLTLTRGSGDDIYLHALSEADEFVNGTFARRYQREDGVIVTDSYKLTQGNIGTVGNATEQLLDENAESSYVIQAVAKRNI